MTDKVLATGKLQGSLSVPASKSLTHRYFILAALSGQAVEVRYPLESDDTAITLEALRRLGYEAVKLTHGVRFTGKKKTVPRADIEVVNSGTSARLLAAILALQPFECRMDGSKRMRERPMGELIEALESLGVQVRHQNGFLPLVTLGGHLDGATVQIDAGQSSQFLSALALIAPCTRNGIRIEFSGVPVSESYLNMTLAVMREAGAVARFEEGVIDVPGSQIYRQQNVQVEGDYSSAAYFLTAAAISAGEVMVRNIKPDSLQGDALILPVLQQAGAEVIRHGQGVTVRGTGRIAALDVDVLSVPDLAPTIAMLALFAGGRSRLRNVHHLRFKECDRLQGLIDNIRRLGGKAETDEVELWIEPLEKPLAARLPSWNDHRMAMCFSLAALRIPGVVIEESECVAKSYPGYWQDYAALFQPADSPGGSR